MKQSDHTQLKILQAANQLFYHRGYNHTSFSDIVNETGLSKGNITYHFKSKKDLLAGIIRLRLEQIERLVQSWQVELDTPLDRLHGFCDMLLSEQQDLQQYGCPIGTLTSEFAKSDPELYQTTLPMFETFRTFLSDQYQQLGYADQTAQQLAMRLLSRTQGLAMMTHVFRDRDFLVREIAQLKAEIGQ